MNDVSVVVPARNAEAMLDECLASIEAQQPREIIVVDGNSTDGTLAIARRHGATILSEVLQQVMDLSPRGIREHLGLNRPIYARTSSYGHFGRAPEADGGFSWEKLDLVASLKSVFH